MEGAVQKVKMPTSLTLEKSGSPRKTISQVLRTWDKGQSFPWHCWELVKHVEYSVTLRRRSRRFPCSLRMRIWRWFKRAIRLPRIVTHLASNHTPEKACSTLSWRGLKWGRTMPPRLDEGSMAESALRPVGRWVACSLLYPGGNIICKYEQFCMPMVSDGEAKFANRKGSPPYLQGMSSHQSELLALSLSTLPLMPWGAQAHERGREKVEGEKVMSFCVLQGPSTEGRDRKEMRIRSYSKFKLPLTVLGWRYNQLTSLFSFPFLLPPSDLGFWIATRSHD